MRLVAPSALSRHIKITRSMADCAGDYVLADRQRLVQALLNLLSNAVKYSGNEAHIFVEAAREWETIGTAGPRTSKGTSSEFIRISVRDTGPGFTDDEKARLFQPFERLGAERTTVPGTGLGLALTRKLVRGCTAASVSTASMASAAPSGSGSPDRRLPPASRASAASRRSQHR